jgi:CO/xanthine dehydrogenase Mo-binding subunit
MNKEFSRRTLLKGGGALIVGFSLAGAGLGAKAAKAAYDPDKTAVDSWLTINADNTVTLKTSPIELGQGLTTGVLMIAAEELDVAMSQIRHSGWDSDILVNSGPTGGSTAIQYSVGPPVRAAAATARGALLDLAATSLAVPRASLTVKDGVVSGGGRSVTYGELVGGKLLNVRMPASFNMAAVGGLGGGTGLAPGQSPAKPVGDYRLIGTRAPRVELPDKITGKYTYVHNVKVPGMLHGRVVRPRGQGPFGTGAKIVSVDESSIKSIPGVRVVRRGDFLGVVAEHEYDAIRAAAQLKVKWQEIPTLPSSGNYWKQLREHDSSGKAVHRDQLSQGNVQAALSTAAKTVSATYKFAYNGRMPIGPHAAVADVKPDRTTIFSNTQSVVGMVPAIASFLGIHPSKVRSIFYEGASTFGSAQMTDVPLAAALMSQTVGKPVRVQLMRTDEHGWDNYGPAQLMDMRGGIDANGKIVAYEYTLLSQTGQTASIAAFGFAGGNPELTQELMGTPLLAVQGTASASLVNTGPMYDIANKRVGAKTMPVFEGYLRTGALRDPQSPQTAFATEQLVDELAYAAGLDPIAFRRLNINPAGAESERWLTAMNAAVKAANWQPRVANSLKQTGNVVKGRGFAFSRHGTAAYPAMIVEIAVNKQTGKITVEHAYLGMDAGLVVNPGLVENQNSGAAIQGISRALTEQVTFNRKQVTSVDWVTYPILRFKDAPKVTHALVQRTDKLPLGAGEPMHSPAGAAIANAFFDATGVRIREAPMTPVRVRSVLKAAAT